MSPWDPAPFFAWLEDLGLAWPELPAWRQALAWWHWLRYVRPDRGK